MEADDGSVGLTVITRAGLGREDDPSFVTNETADDAEIRGLDPEGVTADIIPRALKGAVVGAMIGAVLVGGAAALIDGASGAIAGVLGGLLFGAVIGAVWGAFVRMGGSDAYRETFVEPNVTELMLVSLHTADGAHAERARQALAANADRPPYVVRADEHGIELISAH
jgi:predicted lipid-binding transport protein (Tim44 family)